MREILFRGKNIKGNWCIGLLAHFRNSWYISNKAGVSTAFEVIPETVGQYTGLTDKNGKKIFEGDIMNSAGNVVEFCNGVFCINGDSDLALWTKTEVIGNIHDNPELLEARE